ncbi:hypothetical protein [Streptomyces silaceus]|uniref:hypothetical protein n=1 Tax=Streptomyces silaceus TaxID=545123 RepID=UPI0006EBAA41|nr:hypothetical protein [Streptomyces silaceus]
MAYIGHRCDCGHSDLQHAEDGTSTTLGRCAAEYGVTCSRTCGPLNQSEVIPTFDCKGNRVERVIVPGEGLPSESGASIVKTCPCESCTALHEQVASA